MSYKFHTTFYNHDGNKSTDKIFHVVYSEPAQTTPEPPDRGSTELKEPHHRVKGAHW